MSTQFWMVLGTGAPTYRHDSIASATTEAERLARANPGVTFFVLAAVASVCKSDVVWTRIDQAETPDDVIPF